MKLFNSNSFLGRLLRDERAQMLPIMAVLAIVFMGIAALAVSFGNTYAQYSKLQSSANAAALAGAQALPNSTATSIATNYSSQSGGLNSESYVQGATMVTGWPKLECLTTLTSQGEACVAPANANAIQVKQQLIVPILFGSLFGHPTVTLTATATASMRGAIPAPYNVAIIVDATASMSDTDSDSQCNTSRMSCSLQGIRVLIQALEPCSPNSTTCGTVTAGSNGAGSVVNSVDRLALFSFPNVTTTTVADDYGCNGTNPTKEPYTFPTAGAATYTPLGSPTATYEIVGFSSDYKVSDTATTLNPSTTNNNFVKAVGGVSGCTPMSNPGGEGTYYAGAIYAAQSALVAEQSANPGSQNVLILLSDGDAGTTDSGAMGSASTTSGTYPSTKNQCAQAVTAAKAAATAGTRVYSVAYGAEASGCGTDSPSMTPCQTMQQIASASQNFYSDYTAKGSDSSCISASQPTSNLNQIFLDIAGDLTVARLIPNSTS
jgi:Flp pilus assembly protein TadG